MKINITRFMFFVFLFTQPIFCSAEQSSVIASYSVKYVGNDRFSVKAAFTLPTSRLDLNHHGAVGRPVGQASSVHKLKAFDNHNNPVAIEYMDEGTWRTVDASARRIEYELVADHDSVIWAAGKEEVATKFDASYYFVGDAFFLVDYDWPKTGRIHLNFELPMSWRLASPWRTDGDTLVVYGPDALGRNAFVVGNARSRTQQVGQLELTWLADERVAPAARALAPLFERLPLAYSSFWKGSPDQQLSIFLLSDNLTDGGAFKNSFAMRLDTPLRDSEQPIWMHTMAHELMHIWMDQSNDGIGRREGGSLYWFTEGFTDYLTIKLMRQSDLLDRTMTAQRIANLIRRYAVGRRISVGTGLQAAGDRKHENWELIYGGGAVIALLLDAELSANSPVAFRDMLRHLQHQGGKPLDGNAILNLMDENSAGRASAVFREVDTGLTLGKIRERLYAAGIHVESFASDEVYVEFAECRQLLCADSLWGQRRSEAIGSTLK